jgi:hypothetical protein
MRSGVRGLGGRRVGSLGPRLLIRSSGGGLGVIRVGDIGNAIVQECDAVLGMKIAYEGPRMRRRAERRIIVLSSSDGDALRG